MGFWKTPFEKDPPPVPRRASSPVPASPPESANDAATSADILELSRIGTPDGPPLDDALLLFARLRRSPHEARAIEELVILSASRTLPEPLALAAASALVDRGESATALRLLSSATSPHALLLLADLHAEKGSLPVAVALVERVLLRDFDCPGARERHERWRAFLGLVHAAERDEANAPTLVTSEPETPYVLLREVGRGGAATVYEAEDREIGRRLALKMYHDGVRDRAQLEHEAKSAVLLAGPGVVRVLDVDPHHGWISLEWAPLGSLRDQMRARRRETLFPIERWALPLATTLARIHAAGWVHMDVKPANVLLATRARPLLADFGTARRIGEPSVPGSMGYVSPERLAGRPCDPRDDVYGFGRVVEDALQFCGDESSELTARLRSLASACVAPEEERLEGAAQIVTLLRTEGTR